MYYLEEKLERQTQSGLMGSTAGAAGEALLRDYSQTLWTMYCRYREVKGQPTFMSHSRNQASDAWPLLRARIQEKEKPRKSFLSGTWLTLQVFWFFVYPASQMSEGGSFGRPNGVQEEGLKHHCLQKLPGHSHPP